MMKPCLFAIVSAILLVTCNNSPTEPQEPGGPYTLTTTSSSSVMTITRVPDKAEYSAGDTVRLVADVADGYVFEGWTGDASGGSTTIVIIMDGNKTVLAALKNRSGVRVFSVVADAAHGRIEFSPAGGVYDSGTIVTATAVPSYGYLFSAWTGSLSGTESITTFTISDNKTLGATFSDDPSAEFKILHISPPLKNGSIQTDPSGIVSGDGYKFQPGITVTLTPMPQPGFKFASWAGADSGADITKAKLTILMATDRTLSARFEKIPIGSQWIKAESGTNARLNKVIWTGSRCYVAGDSGTLLTSVDGASWTKIPTGLNAILVDLVWTGKRLVTLTSVGDILTSETGTVWTMRSANLSEKMKTIGWTGSFLAAAGMDGNFATSQDGITWIQRQATIYAFRPTDFEWSGERLYLSGYSTARAYNSNNYEGRVYYTTDGKTWIDFSPGYDCNSIMDITWSGENLLAVGTNGEVYLANPASSFWDSDLWNIDYRTPDGPLPGLGDLYGIIWTGNNAIAVGQTGTIITSIGGYPRQYERLWYPSQGYTFLSIAWTGQRAVVAGALGAIFHTP
jgi:uncharacterized repeat protein (TIGR02543 family)